MPAAKKPTRRKRTTKAKTEPRKKRAYIQAPMGTDEGAPCVHCGERYGHKVTNTYPNGNRRRKCGRCGKPWLSRRLPEVIKE